MNAAHIVANELANQWLATMSAIPWADYANSLHERAPVACGETTSVQTAAGLFDVSDAYEWATEQDLGVRLTIQVFDDPDQPPLAIRTAVLNPSN